jgi:transcriptional accessory protein Tex/SPT6
MDQQPRLDFGRIAQDLQIRKGQVEAVVRLLEEGNAVPFITHYRRGRTGGLREELIREIQHRFETQKQFAERKKAIVKSLQVQGKLNPDLEKAIQEADHPRHLDDLYLPFKPKKPSPAGEARDRGLEPAALAIWNKDPAVANLLDVLPTLINPDKGLPGALEVEAGLKHIVAELFSEFAPLREALRQVLWETGRLTAHRAEGVPDRAGNEYKEFFQLNEPVRHLSPHRVLALNRGEQERILVVKLEWDREQAGRAVAATAPLTDHPHAEFLRPALDEAVQNQILPSIEREIRRELNERAEDHAAVVFARTLRRMFLQPPLPDTRVLAIDPGLRNGCRAAALDEQGKLLEHASFNPFGAALRREERKAKEKKPEAPAAPPPTETPPSSDAAAAPPATPPAVAAPAPVVESAAAPTASDEAPPPAEAFAAPPPAAAAPAIVAAPPPPNRRQEAKDKLKDLIQRHGLRVVSLGNGPGSREMEQLLCELIAEGVAIAYHVVPEAGASQYGGSTLGREELPDVDAAVRAAVSLGRRLQNPLAEFVKLDPQTFNHLVPHTDLSPKRLRETVDTMLDSSVNLVGADLNQAPVTILQRIAGLNALTARKLVEYRTEKGGIKNRQQLKEVPGVTDSVFEQASGFLKVTGGDAPFDTSWLHPSLYELAGKLLERIDHAPASLVDPQKHAEMLDRLRRCSLAEAATQLQCAPQELEEIIDVLGNPGRDVRDDLPRPVLKAGHVSLESLKPGQELQGTVLNVVDFGAFVDVGMKESGLVHISQIANRYIKSPHDVVTVGDVVRVWVLKVDNEKNRVSLTMIPPVVERRPAERRPAPGAEQAGQDAGRPPRPERPPRRPPQPAATPAGGPPQDRPPPRRDQRRQPPPRRPGTHTPYQTPKRDRPLPKLSQEALEGKQDLRTFAELKAFFEAKKDDDEPPPAAATAHAEAPVSAAVADLASAEVPAAPPAETQEPATAGNSV